MKLRLPRRRGWRVAIYLGALLLIAIAIDLIVADARRHVGPGYLTTRIVTPRKPDGSIDYAIALDEYFSRGVTPANNAAIPLLQVLGRAALAKNQPPDGITGALQMPPLPEKGDYFVGYADFMRIRSAPTTRESIEWELPREFTYPIEITPDVAHWAKENDRALTRLVEATRPPRFFVPQFGGQRTLTLLETQLPHAKCLREAGDALHARAMQRLKDGDGNGFIDDALALHRLARLLSQASTMVERIVAMSIETSAGQDDLFAAHSGKLSAQQARRLIAELDTLGELPNYLDAIDRSERFLGMDVVQVLAKLPPTEAGRLFNAVQNRTTLPAWTFRFLPIPYERTMREMNRAYDGMIVAARQRSYPERIESLRLWAAELGDGVQHGPLLNLMSSDWAVSLLLPSLERAEARLATARMQTHLAQVALGLSAFKAEHNAYPATLAELSPTYLPAILLDTFVDKPLIYARTDNGYTLYSLGPNMKDDGGRRGSGDDLVASMP